MSSGREDSDAVDRRRRVDHDEVIRGGAAGSTFRFHHYQDLADAQQVRASGGRRRERLEQSSCTSAWPRVPTLTFRYWSIACCGSIEIVNNRKRFELVELAALMVESSLMRSSGGEFGDDAGRGAPRLTQRRNRDRRLAGRPWWTNTRRLFNKGLPALNVPGREFDHGLRSRRVSSLPPWSSAL